MLLPAIYLGVELVTHRVIITATSVSDVKARSTSDADGSHESYTILDGPPFPWLSWSRRQRPVAILWTGTDGSDHRLSFVWFRRKDAHAIIAGVHALQ